jgi:hypothetical protein
MGNNVIVKLKKKWFGVACLSVSLVWCTSEQPASCLCLRESLSELACLPRRVSGLPGA